MRRLAKSIGKFALGAWLVFWAAYTGVYFNFNDRVLGGFISKRVNKVERGTFTLNIVHFPYWKGLASVLFNTPCPAIGGEYELRDPDGNLVLRVPYVETDVYLRELVASLGKYAVTTHFHLTLHFAHARVPRALAVIAPTQSSWAQPKHEVNIVAAMSNKKPGPPGLGETRIRIDDIEFEDVDFAIGFPNTDGKVSWVAQLTDAHAQASLEYSSRKDLETRDGPWFFFGLRDVRADRGELRMGTYRFPLEALRVGWFGARDQRQTIAFQGTATTLGAPITVDGALTDAYAAAPRSAGVTMTLGFQHARALEAMLPSPLSRWLGGDPSGKIVFGGPFSHVIIDGNVQGAAADLDGLRIAPLASTLHLDGERLLLGPDGQTAGGRVSAQAEIGLERLPWWRANLTVKRVDPAQVPQLPEALKQTLKGRLEATLRLGGSLVPKDVDTIYAQAIDATLEREHPGALPKRLKLTGALDWAPTRVQLKNVQAAGDGLSVQANGNVDPRDGRLQTQVKVDSARGATWIEHLGAGPVKLGEAHATGDVSGTLQQPKVGAHLVVRDLRVAERAAERLEADVSLERGRLALSNVGGAALGGALSGDAALQLLEPDRLALKPTPMLQAHLLAKGVSVKLAAGTPALDGAADVKLDVEGPIDDPTGEMRVEVPHLTLKGDPYEDGLLEVALGSGGASVERLSLKRKGGGTLALKGKGRVGWDGSLDLTLQPKAFPVAAIPGVSGLPVAMQGTLSGEVSVSGDTQRPLVGGLISLAAFKVREVLFGDGNLKLTPGADAIAIKGRLFNQVDVEGYLTLFPKFTVTGTFTFKDLALERILPEMKQLAEITGVASGQARVSFDASSGLTYAGLTLDQVRLSFAGTDEGGRRHNLVVHNEYPVKLSTDGTVLRVDRCQLVSPLGGFQIVGQVAQKDSNVHLHGDIDLVLLEYFFRGAFEHTHGKSNVDLSIQGDLARPKIAGWLNMTNAELQPHGTDRPISVPTGRLEFTADRMTLQQFTVKIGDHLLRASGWVELTQWVPNRIFGDLKGDLSPQLLLAWPTLNDVVAEANGSILVDVHVDGTWQAPEFSGHATVRGLTGKLRNWPHELAVQGGTLRLASSDIVIGCPKGRGSNGCRALSGSIDDHPVSLEGTLTVGGEYGIKAVDVAINGDELHQEADPIAIVFSPHVRLHGALTQLMAEGTIDVNEGRYTQDFAIQDLIIRPRTFEKEVPFWVGHPSLETMQLNVHAQSTGPLYIKSNIAELTMAASVDITGTLSDPRFAGTLHVDEGGKFKIPGFRADFDSDSGTVSFDPEKRIPDQTPTLEVGGTAVVTDNSDNQHTVIMRIVGTITNPGLKLSSQEGWDQAATLLLLLTGQTPDQIRKLGTTDPTAPRSANSTSGAENVIKTVTGYGVGQVIGDPLRQVFHLDIANVQFGTGSFDVTLCKRFGRYIKACGLGEVGFASATGSRVQSRLELKLSDWVSAQGYVEYLNNNIVESTQDSLTRGKLELKFQFPIGF